MKDLKDKIVKFFKNDLKYYSINFWNLITHLFKEKKMQTYIVLSAIVIIIIFIILVCSINNIDSTSRNLANFGFTVKKGNHIYYCGYDEGNVDGIYKVKTNKKGIEKVNSDYVTYLNSDGKYIYYFDCENDDIVRIKSNGTDKQTLVESVDFTTVSLYDNYIYYVKDSNFYKIKTNGKDNIKLLNKSIYSYEVNKNWIYYTYYNNGEYLLAKITTDGKEKTVIEEESGKEFFVKGNYIYYLYENKTLENGVNGYDLYKIKNDGTKKILITTLTNLDVQTINTDGKKIYYAKTDSDGNYAIYSIKLNGKDETKIVDVKEYMTHINVIDGYIYYLDQNEKENSSVFRIKTSGGEKQEII